MRADVCTRNGDFIRYEEVDPECGKHFCDSCGDCLDCYPDACVYNPGGGHHFVIYGEENVPVKEAS